MFINLLLRPAPTVRGNLRRIQLIPILGNPSRRPFSLLPAGCSEPSTRHYIRPTSHQSELLALPTIPYIFY